MTSDQLLNVLKINPFVLAPMAGITDCAFRSFMHEMGASVVITELVSATGLKYSSERTRSLMSFEESQRPIGIQLFGEDLEALSIAAKEVEQMGADFVDINFGCPVPKVVKKGAGSAALKDLIFLRDVIRSVKSAVQMPVTIKVRTGWDQQTRNTHEVVQIAYDEGVTWVAIHGRTRAQGYAGQSDWDYIAEVKGQSKVAILGNGDLSSARRANQRLLESGCDGVMIGRGCLKNPWIFIEAHAQWANRGALAINPVIRDFNKIFEKLESHLKRTSSEKVVALQTKKLAAWYSAGYPGSSQFRKNVFTQSDPVEVKRIINEYFSQLTEVSQQDTSDEAFLMGGHG